MNEIAKIEHGMAVSLEPTNMPEAMALANLMAGAKLVPTALQKSPADCLMVIMQAKRWNLDPFAVAQECSVIQGKLMHSGKLVAAVINSRGGLTQRLSFEYDGEGDKRTITVSGQLRGEPEPRTVNVTLKEARTPNKVWQTQPDQQLMYHGSRVWARRHTPELMLGVWSPEEFDDGPAKERRAPTPAPLKMAKLAEVAPDPETGENTDDNSVVREADAAPLVAPDDSSAPTGREYGAEETTTDRMERLDKQLSVAATKGTAALKGAWDKIDKDDQAILRAALDNRHRPTAAKVDKAGATP